MSKHRFTRAQKTQILKDYDSKRYTPEDLLEKHKITLQNLYSWRHQLKKRAAKRSEKQIHHIVEESERLGVAAACENNGLKKSTLYEPSC